MDKIFVNVDKYGNTSAASIPIAMDEARQNGLIKDGSIVVAVSFGAGLSWASFAMRM
ncbi:MAG: 3-oxoacyl-[acyl-carrier-protein] synthase III C-terminal domain-containing protein, partial [Armatimonadota bacterium]